MDDPSEQGQPVELSEEETAVMLGHFAGASYTELAESTGIEEGRLEEIMGRLTELGLIEPPELIPLEPEEPPVVDLHLDERPVVDLGFDVDEPPVVDLGPIDLGPIDGEPAPLDDLAVLDGALDALGAGDEGDAKAKKAAEAKAPAAEAKTEKSDDAPAEEEIDLAVAEPTTEADDVTVEFRKLYETTLHPLPAEQRIELAGTVSDNRLFALCFDPDAQVIAKIFENTAANVEHARLVAFHHRTARGLSELTSRASLCGDPLVQRRLVRNPATDEPMLRRLIGSKRLLEIYKVSLDRDVPERSRAAARNIFRQKWTTAQPEERVEVVMATEGRVLLAISGINFDSRTTLLMCGKNIGSVMLIQNLARWNATPPGLLSHILKQPLVKRQVHLKNVLLQHPNTPSEAKRRL
jgi:hypothetical protein